MLSGINLITQKLRFWKKMKKGKFNEHFNEEDFEGNEEQNSKENDRKKERLREQKIKKSKSKRQFLESSFREN